MNTLRIFATVSLCLFSQILYAQEQTGWDTHEISKKAGAVGVILLIIVLVLVYNSKNRKK